MIEKSLKDFKYVVLSAKALFPKGKVFINFHLETKKKIDKKIL